VRRLATLAAGLLLLALAGCVQVEETVALELDGSGTYDLDLTWDADLARRLVGLVGEETAARLLGRPLPLTEAAWRDTLADLEGVEVQTASVETREGGRRHVRIRLAFDRLPSLLAWELFARRSLRIGPAPGSGEAQEGPVTWVQDPLARVPLLDPLGRALALHTNPPAPEGGRFPLLDPGPRQRLGLSATKADLAVRMLRPALEEISLTFRVRAPRTVRGVEGAAGAARAEGREATFPWTFRTLLAAPDRRLTLTWTPRGADVVPTIDHAGDRPGESR
jgi:hypothetical protein